MAAEKDIVLIYLEKSPLAFARIESIEPDVKRGWYQVKLMLLQIPLQVVTWILRDAYINGEIFTMGGKEMRMERIVCPEETKPTEEDGRKTKVDQAVAKKNGKVINLANLKKK